MENNRLFLLAILIGVFNFKAAAILNVDLYRGKRAGFAQIIDDVKFKFEHKVKEAAVPHFNENRTPNLAGDLVHKLAVFIIKIFDDTNGDLKLKLHVFHPT